MSMSTRSAPRALAASIVSKATAAGSAPCLWWTTCAPRARPRRELLDGRRAEGVGRAEDDLCPRAVELRRDLADGRGLAHAVDAHHQDHVRPRRPQFEVALLLQ